MYRKIWITVNIFLIIGSIIYIWIFRPHDSMLIIIAQLLAQISILLFLININMYFIFLVIRKTPQRKIKITLANFSRKMMHYHILIAITGTILIIGHAMVMIIQLGPLIGFTSFKRISGYLSTATLTITLFAGYLRHEKSSGIRRKFHLLTAMIFALSFLIHMIL